ncbi:hypothetical protein CYY_009545 [Polysphondylium violaceum]|uniref:Ankyrin repeat-containing protein n=1 Tax=Polysphondylium violaceum TaxID=133409 RepID=A0A8J4V0F0_9MYCE|nr:hypothetical protein CYY_009545 [Polysphondylium violaceum]
MEKTFKFKLHVDLPFIELAIKHHKTFEYILQNYGYQMLLTYNQSATQPPVISILESLARSGSLETIELLDDKGLVKDVDGYSILAHQALLSNQIGIYNYAKQKDPSISVNVALHQIEGVMKDVQLVVMYQVMGAEITSECVIQACTYIGVFVYIFEYMNPSIINSRIHIENIDCTESIVKKCLESNNVAVLEYLCKNGYLSTININLLHEYQIKIGKDSELELVKFILTHTTKMDALSIYNILLEAACTSSVEIFKFVYPYHMESKLLTTDQIFNLINAGTKKGCLEIIKLILSCDDIVMTPGGIIHESLCSNLDVLSFFYDNHFSVVSQGLAICFKKALQTEQWECARYLNNKFNLKYIEVNLALECSANLAFIKEFLIKCNPLPSDHQRYLYIGGLEHGHLDVAKYFYNHQITILLDTKLIVNVIHNTHVHVLEFIKNLPYCKPKTFKSLGIPKTLPYYQVYKPLVLAYCSSK